MLTGSFVPAAGFAAASREFVIRRQQTLRTRGSKRGPKWSRKLLYSCQLHLIDMKNYHLRYA
jgi:hypothetical protein